MKRFLYFAIPVFYILHIVSLMCSMAGMEFFGWGGFLLVIIAEVYERVVNKRSIFINHPFNKYVFIFATVIIASVILSPNLSQAQQPWFYYVGRTRYLLLFFFHASVLTYFINTPKLIKLIPVFILPLILLYSFESVSGSDVLKGNYNFIWDWTFARGIKGYFVHYIEFATIFELFAFMLLPFLFYKEYRLSYKIFLGVVLLISFFSMTVSGTRAFFMALPVAIVAQTLFSRNKKAFLVILLIFLTTPFVAYKLSPFLRNKKNNTVINIKKFGDPYRYNLWRAHLLMFKDNPILGAGFYMPIEEKFVEPYYQKLKTLPEETFRGTTLAHNSYIDMLSGSGVLGLLAFVIFLFMLTKYLLSARLMAIEKNDIFSETLSVGLIGSLSSLCINMLVDSTFHMLKVCYTFMFIAGLCIYLHNKLKKPTLKHN